MSSIRLHTKHGVAPALVYCFQCGKETNELALLGVSCDTVMKQVTGSGYKGYGHNRIPGGLCDECKAKRVVCDAEVKLGGIYWKCTKCHSEGAIKVGHPLVAHVREQMKIAVGPVGVDLTGRCPVCKVDQ